MAGVFAYGAAPSNENGMAAGLRRTVSMNDIARRQRESRASMEAMAAEAAATPLSNSGSAAFSTSSSSSDSVGTDSPPASTPSVPAVQGPPLVNAAPAPRRPRTGTGTTFGRSATIAQLPIPIPLAPVLKVPTVAAVRRVCCLLRWLIFVDCRRWKATGHHRRWAHLRLRRG
jgi:hypothetical protein